jgi:hypothetical protein
MSNRRHSTQQVLDPANQQSIVARLGNQSRELRIVAPTSVNLTDPVADMFVAVLGVERRQGIQLQMIVGVQEARQQAISPQVDPHVARNSGGVDTRDSRPNHAHRAHFSFSCIGQCQATRCRRHVTYRRARTISTIGKPCQSR